MPTSEEIEVLHWMDNPPPQGMNSSSPQILPTLSAIPRANGNGSQQQASDAELVALSETDTLAYSREQRMELQDTFDENYTTYLPFVLRRLRREHELALAGMEGAAREGAARPENHSSMELVEDQDDEKTIALATDELGRHIMRRQSFKYNYKRQLILVSEFIRSNTYVFSDQESFRVFRYLRSHNKKLRKNSMIVFDPNGNIKRIKRRPSEVEGDPDIGDGLVDLRQHIIPLDYKLKGSGLPLFKIQVPYMSSFRKKVPYMVFKRYKELPAPPSQGNEPEDDENFETYEYCTVHMKTFQQYKRYILHFTPDNAPPFKLLVFQNNYRPFTDFTYKDTRFRVLGLSLMTAYLMNYNPELKLIVIDDNQPSLCDNIVEKKSHHLRGQVNGSNGQTQPEYFNNPVPDENNTILSEDKNLYIQMSKRNYIPNNMPPFGRFVDSCAYPNEHLILPKRYSEVGKLELYQALESVNHPDMSSTLAVDPDQMVLTTVLLTLRETSLRTTNRYSNASLVSRMGTFAISPGLGTGGGMGFPYTSTM